jgi:quinol monooxygenase YgiN
MFLRATRIQAPPDKVEQVIENFETNVIKGLRAAPGNQGAVLVVNRETGAALGITYWESAKALASSEQTGAQSRTQAVKGVPGTQIVNVERAELMIMDRAGEPRAGTFVGGSRPTVTPRSWTRPSSRSATTSCRSSRRRRVTRRRSPTSTA